MGEEQLNKGLRTIEWVNPSRWPEAFHLLYRGSSQNASRNLADPIAAGFYQ